MIIGSSGMLGHSMTRSFSGFEVISLSRKELDITCYAAVRQQFYLHKPQYVINCAAYTAVDKAESEPAAAFQINYSAVRVIARIAKQIDATLIHFSTDYMFDGTSEHPYLPCDITNPINVYGANKLMEENAIRSLDMRYYIFRISWLYAAHGKNFFRWVMENDLEEMKVVDNQKGSPTSAADVAAFIEHVIGQDP